MFGDLIYQRPVEPFTTTSQASKVEYFVHVFLLKLADSPVHIPTKTRRRSIQEFRIRSPITTGYLTSPNYFFNSKNRSNSQKKGNSFSDFGRFEVYSFSKFWYIFQSQKNPEIHEVQSINFHEIWGSNKSTLGNKSDVGTAEPFGAHFWQEDLLRTGRCFGGCFVGEEVLVVSLWKFQKVGSRKCTQSKKTPRKFIQKKRCGVSSKHPLSGQSVKLPVEWKPVVNTYDMLVNQKTFMDMYVPLCG